MNHHVVYRRGQPVMTLAVVLTAWVAMRAVTWGFTAEAGEQVPGPVAAPVQVAQLPMPALAPEVVAGQAGHLPPLHAPQQHRYPAPRLRSAAWRQRGGVNDNALPDQAEGPAADVAELAAITALPPVPYVSRDAMPPTRRWSADGWMMLRDGGASTSVTGPTRATYGASQLGAVLRYRLAPESGHRPTAYLRGTAALIRPHDREVAAGLSARPVSGLPFTVAAELRAGEINSATRVRPAVMAVTELLPQKLPLDLLGEAYAQAGYVGGKGATAFVDGQLRVDTDIARIGRAELRVGGGAWGGAQKGASRLDVGPAANLGISVNNTIFARLTVDWRFRVAGNAVPESGPALTLSAGF